ncbi:hypothetical protein L209DRAFT_251991 [Thermothelomyces heterothallicus CBS 203.75]
MGRQTNRQSISQPATTDHKHRNTLNYSIYYTEFISTEKKKEGKKREREKKKNNNTVLNIMASNTDSHPEAAPPSTEPDTGRGAKEQAQEPAQTQTQTRARARAQAGPEPATEAESQRIDALLARYLALLDEYAALRTRLGDLQAAVFRDLARANFAAERGVRYYGRDYYDERMQAVRRVRVRMPVPVPVPVPAQTQARARGSGGGAGGGEEGRSSGDLDLEDNRAVTNGSANGAERAEAAATAGLGGEEGARAVNGASGGEGEGGREEEGGGEKGGGWTGPVFSVEVYPPPGGEREDSESTVKRPGQEESGPNGKGASGLVEKEAGKGEADGDGDGDGEGDKYEKRWGGGGSTITATATATTTTTTRQAQSHSIKAVEEIIPRLATLSAEMAGVELEVRRARKRRARAEKAEEKRLAELGEMMAKVNVGASMT